MANNSTIVPVFKKGDDIDKTCYCPKIYEKVLLDQMHEEFNINLSSSLSGYLKGHSCCTALLKVTKDWRVSIDNREHMSSVAIDLRKT